MPYTPKKTLSLILESGNDYLVAVKSNQGKLYRQLETIATYRRASQPSVMTQEQHHGRHEQRHVSVFSATGIDTQQWPGARTILCIQRQRSYRGRQSTHRAYYLSSASTTAQRWMSLIRGHWSIENRLHWPKDRVLKEDDTYGRQPNALLTASLFRSIAINLLRLNGFDSLSFALRQLANRVDLIFPLLQ